MFFPAIDLHNHTTASDGRQTPTQLVQMALAKGLNAIAITDHDTTSGVKEAVEAAKGTDLFVIPGVELSIDFAGELHMLGLFLDIDNDEFVTTMQTLRDGRVKRTERMVQKLNDLGFPLTMDDVYLHAKGETVGRGHVARALAAKGYVKSANEAFEKYLAYGACAYVPNARLSLEEAIRLLRRIGAVAVWAHPMQTARDQMTLHALYEEMKSYGLCGMECFHPSASAGEARMLEKWCMQDGLCVTAGTDFHDHPNGAPFGWAADQLDVNKYDKTAAQKILSHQRWIE
ncbi:MAG: PHP domain-containing protein [Clostridia bacterium]|nr:PHP domain-containing protein [Clostridia bacterium]